MTASGSTNDVMADDLDGWRAGPRDHENASADQVFAVTLAGIWQRPGDGVRLCALDLRSARESPRCSHLLPQWDRIGAVTRLLYGLARCARPRLVAPGVPCTGDVEEPARHCCRLPDGWLLHAFPARTRLGDVRLRAPRRRARLGCAAGPVSAAGRGSGAGGDRGRRCGFEPVPPWPTDLALAWLPVCHWPAHVLSGSRGQTHARAASAGAVCWISWLAFSAAAAGWGTLFLAAAVCSARRRRCCCRSRWRWRRLHDALGGGHHQGGLGAVAAASLASTPDTW